MIIKSKIRKLFRERNMRVPTGFIPALETFTRAIVDSALISGNGKITTENAVKFGNHSDYKLLPRHIAQALSQLEKEGRLDCGELIPTARRIAATEPGNKTQEDLWGKR